MDIQTKLSILADAAKYDASCASSGSRRQRVEGGLGNTTGVGICHSYTPDGRCVSLLKVLLAAKSEQHHVASRLVANSDDIDRLALEEDPDVPALHGWRREVFGNDALLLKQGRMALGVDGKRVKFIPV